MELSEYLEPEHPWEKLPEESSKAYAAFSHYLDMPIHKRSLRELCRQLYESKHGDGDDETVVERKQGNPTNFSQAARWSTKWKWVQRSQARDAYLARIKFHEQDQEVKDMAKRHANQAKTVAAALTLPSTVLLKNHKKISTMVDKNEMTPDTLELLVKSTVAGARELPKVMEAEKESRNLLQEDKEKSEDLPTSTLLGDEIDKEFDMFLEEDKPKAYREDEEDEVFE